MLPADATLTNGTGTFSATLESVNATYTITATDTVSSSISGTSGDIAVSYALPVAVDDTAYTTDHQPVTIDVLANDTDPSGLTLTVISTTQGKKGSVSINQDGTVLYTPNAKPKGLKTQPNDQFTYTIDDGFGNTATATVSVRDTFVASAGSYDGLLVNLAPTNDDTGYLQVKTDGTGKFKGTLYVGGVKFPVKGGFSDSGDYTGSVTRPGSSALAVQLHLDPGASTISGPIADASPNTFTSSVIAKKQVKAGSLAGSYTVILPASSNFTGPNYPQGDGFATMKISKKGKVTISGRMGDGTAFLSKTFLHADSTFDLYASLYARTAPFAGSVSGALTFEDITGVNASDADGAVAWFKPASIIDPIYPSGFAMNTTALVSHYQKPKAGHSVFTLVSGPDNGQIILADDSTVEASSTVTIKENNLVTVSLPNTNKIQLSIIPATGRISGSFLDPVSQTKQSFQGVVFQKQNVGAGVYTSAPQSYYFVLTPN
ncbi:MAG: Ig-like domain-containing protein [Chthoniobacteraceae bacterium]